MINESTSHRKQASNQASECMSESAATTRLCWCCYVHSLHCLDRRMLPMHN